MTTLIGGEMLLWSDLDGTHGPAPASTPAVRPLLAAAPGRTLVAGPHDPALIDELPDTDVTVLVRGLSDAEGLTTRYAGRPGVRVLCGSLEKLAGQPAYDTVIALDGLDRLLSAEAEDRPWDETLTLLLAVLGPGGRLLLGVENLFGVHRLPVVPGEAADAEWVTADDHDPARPAGRARLLARLREAGLSPERDYAAYPAGLFSPQLLTDPGLVGYLEATLTAEVAPTARAAPTAPVAPVAPVAGAVPAGGKVPARLVTGAIRNGLAADLAPGWVVVATRGPAVVPAGGRPDAIIRGDRLAGGGRAGAGPRVIRLGTDDLPRGRTLEDLLLTAAQRRRLPALRELLTTWHRGSHAGVRADRIVVAPDGRFTAPAPAPAGEPLLALRAFAAAVVDGGYAHLWPAPADEAELTALLAGMTGRELDPADVPPRLADPAAAPDLRELLMARDRLTRELAEARAKHEWYEGMLQRREAELKRVRRINAVLSATVPGRAATTLVGGLRAGKRAVRAVVRRTRDQD